MFAGAVALLVVLIQQLPYAVGYLAAPPGTEYSGLLVNLSDVTYLVGIQLGIQGEWLYHIRFTSEPHEGALLYTFYLALGQLARILGLNGGAMWHLARGVCAFLMALVVYGFIAHFIRQPRWRRLAFVLALVGAGLDLARFPWEPFDPVDALPLEFRMMEAHLFFSTLAFPHYSAAIALIAVAFWCALRGMTEPLTRRKWALLAVCGAAASLGVTFVYPFLFFLVATVLGVFFLFLLARARRVLWLPALFLGIVLVPTLPLLLYYERVLATNETIRLWNEQVLTYSPNPLHYLLTYGLYLVPALWNLHQARLGKGERQVKRAFLWIWVGVVTLLLYAPLNAQRRFVEGVHIPLTILAVISLYETVLPRLEAANWFRRLASRPGYSVAGVKRLLVVLYVGVAALASLYLLSSGLLTNLAQQPYPFFRPSAELAAMDWLRAHAGARDVVLSSYWSGAWLPLRAGTLAYIGQYYETNHFFDKFAEVERFFGDGMSDPERRDFLRERNVAFVFWGPAERRDGGFDPRAASYLRRVFDNPAAAIFQVVAP